MASVNVKKYTASGARGMAVHFDDIKRKEMNHANPHIDKDMTERNYWIGANSYNGVLYKLKERQLELDKLKPPKRLKADRITCAGITVPIPRVLTERGQADDFARDSYEVLERVFGADNVHGMTVHKDEVHDYIDPKTKETCTSLEHGHAFITPEDPEKGLNAKACLNKQKLRDLQKAMNDMCFERYGIEYNTHEIARNLAVEELKTASIRAEQELLQEKLSLTQDTLSKADTKLSTTKEEIKKVTTKLDKVKKELKSTQIDDLKLKEISEKTIWSADDKAYVLERAQLGSKTQSVAFNEDFYKRQAKSLKNDVAAINQELSETKKSQSMDKIATLKYQNRELSEKADLYEKFISENALSNDFKDFKKSIKPTINHDFKGL